MSSRGATATRDLHVVTRTASRDPSSLRSSGRRHFGGTRELRRHVAIYSCQPRQQELSHMPSPHNATQHPIHDLLGNRWSPRAFAPDRLIEPATLRSLLEAARWSPSSSNGQPWSFLVAPKQDAAEFQKMLGCLVEANQVWAKTASVLMISVAAKNFEHHNKPNAHYAYDTGASVAHLTFEAAARGLYVHQMAGFDA